MRVPCSGAPTKALRCWSKASPRPRRSSSPAGYRGSCRSRAMPISAWGAEMTRAPPRSAASKSVADSNVAERRRRCSMCSGEIAAASAPLEADAAEAHYRQAMALARKRDMRPLVAHCHLGLGKLYRSTGKPKQAREHLATATAMYREMGMMYWPEWADSEPKELGSG